jgi:hypothetical protein
MQTIMHNTTPTSSHLHFEEWAKLNEVPRHFSELLTKMIDLGSFVFLYRFMPLDLQDTKAWHFTV